jgi:hypothetical protein
VAGISALGSADRGAYVEKQYSRELRGPRDPRYETPRLLQTICRRIQRIEPALTIESRDATGSVGRARHGAAPRRRNRHPGIVQVEAEHITDWMSEHGAVVAGPEKAAELVAVVEALRWMALSLDKEAIGGVMTRDDAPDFEDQVRQARLGVVPEHVVHPVLLGGWWLLKPQSQGVPDEAAR